MNFFFDTWLIYKGAAGGVVVQSNFEVRVPTESSITTLANARMTRDVRRCSPTLTFVVIRRLSVPTRSILT